MSMYEQISCCIRLAKNKMTASPTLLGQPMQKKAKRKFTTVAIV
jgi:hypothetical protein